MHWCHHLHTHTHTHIYMYVFHIHVRMHRRIQHYNTLQHTATHCNTLQHPATHCNTLPYTGAHAPTHTAAAARCTNQRCDHQVARISPREPQVCVGCHFENAVPHILLHIHGSWLIGVRLVHSWAGRSNIASRTTGVCRVWEHTCFAGVEGVREIYTSSWLSSRWLLRQKL